MLKLVDKLWSGLINYVEEHVQEITSSDKVNQVGRDYTSVTPARSNFPAICCFVLTMNLFFSMAICYHITAMLDRHQSHAAAAFASLEHRWDSRQQDSNAHRVVVSKFMDNFEHRWEECIIK